MEKKKERTKEGGNVNNKKKKNQPTWLLAFTKFYLILM